MAQPQTLVLTELIIFGGGAVAWGIWEVFRTQQAINKHKAKDAPAVREQASGQDADASMAPVQPRHPPGP
jgi:hypothetical protein